MERQLIDQYIATGKIRFEYHHYTVVDSIVGGTESQRAAEASECANEQGQFWDFHKLLFSNQQGEGQGAFSDRRLKAFAETLGLDTGQFNACFDAGRFSNAVRADTAEGQTRGVTGTPTVFVNGQIVPMQGPVDWTTLQAAIEAALAQ